MWKKYSIKQKATEVWQTATTRYGTIITTYPVAVLLITGSLSTLLTILGGIYGSYPDLSDPKVGFETRGTDLSGKIMTWRSLYEDEITLKPSANTTYFQKLEAITKPAITRKKRSRTKREKNFLESIFLDALGSGPCLQISQPFKEAIWFSHVVVEAESSEALFKLETIQELCQFQISLNKTFGPLRPAIDYPQFWSLPNYLTCLSGQVFCQNLTQQDLDLRVADIKSCLVHKVAILKCSSPTKHVLPASDPLCQTIPATCTSKYYYDLFSFALSKNIFQKNSGPVYSVIVMPILQLRAYINQDTANVDVANFTPIYKDITSLKDTLKYTKMVGLNLGMKIEAFGPAILLDSVFLLLAAIVATIICLSYSGSLFYAFTIALSLKFSIGVSYFIYCIVFQINFFPFINLLVVVLLVGIGADNTFILKHIFDNAELQNDASNTTNFSPKDAKTVNVNLALSHAARSMFITNATTAAAFYANYVSDVIVMKCFGIFAGTTMLVNYLLIISWLPASLIILDRYINPRFQGVFCCTFCESFDNLRRRCSAGAEFFIEKIVYKLIEKLHYLWIVSFVVVFIASTVIVFYKPGVALPKRNPLQLYRNSHLFEWYDNHVEDLFYFSFNDDINIDIDIVWGIKPADIGRPLDPKDVNSTGSFKVDRSFQISMKTLQGLDFICNKLSNSTLLINRNPCFTKQFFAWSKIQQCNRSIICCNYENQKFNETLLNDCLLQSSRDFSVDGGGPLFRTDKLGAIDGYFMYFDTIFNWTLVYEDLEYFYKSVDSEVTSALVESHTQDLQRGWWTTTWQYMMLWYDLQHSLLHGTPPSIAISVLVALVVAIVTTRTLVLSFLSIISICGVIMTTIACLVLLDWHLNIVESTIIILTAGLSFDFTLLYAAAYKISKNGLRREKVLESLNFIGLPVFLSAFVTFSVGICMLPSVTWAYYQIGCFMALVIVVSYLSSTLFFLSLLYLWGPQETDVCNYKRLPCFDDDT